MRNMSSRITGLFQIAYDGIFHSLWMPLIVPAQDGLKAANLFRCLPGARRCSTTVAAL